MTPGDVGFSSEGFPGTGGFRSFVGFTADGRLGVLVLSNSSEDVDDLAVDLLLDIATAPPGAEGPSGRGGSPVEAGLRRRDQS